MMRKNAVIFDVDYCTRKQRERQCLSSDGRTTKGNGRGVESNKGEKLKKNPIVQNDEPQNEENRAGFLRFQGQGRKINHQSED